MKRAIYEKLLQASHCRRGSVAILMAFSLIMLVLGTGIAIDMSRMQTVKTELYSCLDTAGLAALAKVANPPPGTSSMSDWVTQNVTTYFLANCRKQYLQTDNVTFTSAVVASIGDAASAGVNNVAVSLVSDNSSVVLDAKLTESTEFMPVVGIHTVTVTAHSVVSRTTGGLELALVLDNTGSMNDLVNSNNSAPKIDALKCAVAGEAAFGGGTYCGSKSLATIGLLDVLYNGNPSTSNLFVGVVPFTDMVNLNLPSSPGQGFLDQKLSPPSGSQPSDGSKCIDSRPSAPNGSLAETSYIDAKINSRSIFLDTSDDPPAAASPPARPYSTYFKALPNRNTKDNQGTTHCPAAAVQWMSSSKSDAVNTIHAMKANGNTMLPIGLTWGWRMLSPNWRKIWGSMPTFNGTQLPLDYNTAGMTKVMVFMTDGMNDNGNGPNSGNAACANSVNAYGDLPSSQCPTVATLDQKTRDLCDAVKSHGIVIYTIGFGNAGDVNTDVLNYCATDSQHYFLAPTNDALSTAFKTIAGQLSNLVVSQ